MNDGLKMIPVVNQNGDFGNSHGFGLEVIDVERQHFNQSLVIGDIGLGAMGKERKSQRIDGEMTFDAIGSLVVTKAFGSNAGVADVFNRLGVNQN